jgi:hypothetical protein
MSAPVSRPNLTPLSILNVTRTLLPLSSMSWTLPTEMPATRTSLPVLSAPISAKSA